MKWILASQSPRRREILENIGLDFRVVTADTDETCHKSDPVEYVTILATRKGEAVRRLLADRGELTEDTLIIASDTVVVSGGEIMGKPHDKEDAVRMLRAFSGVSHEVVSGVALLTAEKCFAQAETTKVIFDTVSEKELALYVETDEPYDKAGGYAIQGFASLWIKGIEGDYFNVVGFPIKCFSDMLKQHLSLSLAETVGNKGRSASCRDAI